MPKINVYLPDELAESVKEANIPVSAVCQRALEQAVRRITAVREMTSGYLNSDELAAKLPLFTDRARTVLTLATSAARAEGAAELGTRHLLGGLLTEANGMAMRVLRALEIEPAQVAAELAGRSSTAPAGRAPGSLGLSATAATALELTVIESATFGHSYRGTEHLLLGLIAEPDGTAGQVLRSLGTDLRLTRRAVAAALAGFQHLRSEIATGTAASIDTTPALAAVVRKQLAPLIQRIERLEQHRASAGAGSPAESA
jgi:ATP-dependent Clp protease ATP-binding subunit ClpC